MAKVININSMSFPPSLPEELPQRLIVTMDAPKFEGADGRVFINADPQKLIEFFASGGKQLPIDIEHSTQLQGKQGLPAPAVGWVTGLEAEGLALYAIVNWTEQGEELLRSESYKYYSPAFYCTPAEGRNTYRITGLASLGLTNIPNLRVPALNQEEGEGMEGEEMDKQIVCNALGIDTQSAEEQVVEQINSLKSQQQEALNRAEAAEAKLSEVQAKLAGMEAEALKAEVNSAIEKAVSEGKILPYQKDHYESTIQSREALNSFNEMTAKAPVQIPGGSQITGKPDGAQEELNADQKAVFEALGLSEDERKKAQEELKKV